MTRETSRSQKREIKPQFGGREEKRGAFVTLQMFTKGNGERKATDWFKGKERKGRKKLFRNQGAEAGGGSYLSQQQQRG